MAAQKRLGKEIADIQANPIAGIKVQLKDGHDLLNWEVAVDGPQGSPFEGGVFKLQLKMAQDYPFKPPVIQFLTKIYHMNVSNDDKGSMCLGMLRSDQWKPPNRIAQVLEMVRNLLYEPNPDDAVESSIANQWKTDRAAYDKTAREWTAKYAKS